MTPAISAPIDERENHGDVGQLQPIAVGPTVRAHILDHFVADVEPGHHERRGVDTVRRSDSRDGAQQEPDDWQKVRHTATTASSSAAGTLSSHRAMSVQVNAMTERMTLPATYAKMTRSHSPNVARLCRGGFSGRTRQPVARGMALDQEIQRQMTRATSPRAQTRPTGRPASRQAQSTSASLLHFDSGRVPEPRRQLADDVPLDVVEILRRIPADPTARPKSATGSRPPWRSTINPTATARSSAAVPALDHSTTRIHSDRARAPRRSRREQLTRASTQPDQAAGGHDLKNRVPRDFNRNPWAGGVWLPVCSFPAWPCRTRPVLAGVSISPPERAYFRRPRDQARRCAPHVNWCGGIVVALRRPLALVPARHRETPRPTFSNGSGRGARKR